MTENAITNAFLLNNEPTNSKILMNQAGLWFVLMIPFVITLIQIT